MPYHSTPHRWRTVCIVVLLAFVSLHLPDAETTVIAGAGAGSLGHEVEWRIPVGCDFSGFFTEVVAGYLPFLLARGVKLKLLHGGCVRLACR